MALLDPDSTNREEGWAKRPYQEGEDVLLHGSDGLMYFGIIVEVDYDTCQCLVRFGDCTEKWSPFYDLRRLGDANDEEDENFETVETVIPAKRRKSDPDELAPHVIAARKELPYDFETLVWDNNHQRNDKERYCYCGESGDWYKKMIQCNRCLQWYHQDCIRTQTYPMLFGDRFFDFECTICTGKHEELMTRLDISLVDAVHLVLFNLTIINSKRYHDIETSIIPFFKRKWKCLQGPGCIIKSSRLDPQFLNSLLRANKTRFKCGSEIKKRSTFWGLRKVVPPSTKSDDTVNYKLRQSTVAAPITPKEKVPTAIKSANAIKNGTAIKSANGLIIPKLKKEPRKRGRPRKRDSLETSETGGGTAADSDTSSRGTLDAIIPPPKDFEGFNNPFRNLGIGQYNVSTTEPPSEVTSPQDTEEAPPPKSPGKFLSDLKCSLHSYFGAETRMAKGEKFKVCARRLNMDGDIQYLIEWEQPNPLSPTVD